MASTFLYTLVCFTAVLALGTCQDLSCYDCDPQHFGPDCVNPVERNVRTVRCVPAVDNLTSVCLSAYLIFTGEKEAQTGIYRGCNTLRPDVDDFCDWFAQENNGPNLTVASCNTCKSTRCNTVKYKIEDKPSGAETVSTSIFILVLNSMVVLLLTVFE